MLIPALTAGGEDASVLTYQAAAVTEGEISASVSGSGTLSALNAASFTAPADATVEEVLVLPGARVSAGDTILTLSSDTLDEELETLRDELESVNESLAGARQEAASRYVTAGRAGVVKEILAASGDIVDDAGALCRIATDGNMRLELADAPDTLRQYDAVSVVIGEETARGPRDGAFGAARRSSSSRTTATPSARRPRPMTPTAGCSARARSRSTNTWRSPARRAASRACSWRRGDSVSRGLAAVRACRGRAGCELPLAQGAAGGPAAAGGRL